MKKIKLLLLLFSILVLALNSCVLLFIPVSQSFPDCADEKLLSIRKGMTSEDVNEVMLSHTSGLIYDVYLIEDIKSDTHDISEMIKSKNKTTILITQKKNINGELFFIFAFENDKLIYWGLPIDFKRSSDAKFVKIGKEAVRIIHRDYLDD